MTQPANLILFQSDNHNGQITGCYGHPVVKTPVMDALASKGVLFENGFVQAPFTGSSSISPSPSGSTASRRKSTPPASSSSSGRGTSTGGAFTSTIASLSYGSLADPAV